MKGLIVIRITCDNCGKMLRDKIDDSGAEPEKQVTLKMHIEGTSSYPVDMDLCIRCAKKYVTVLKEPV